MIDGGLSSRATCCRYLVFKRLLQGLRVSSENEQKGITSASRSFIKRGRSLARLQTGALNALWPAGHMRRG